MDDAYDGMDYGLELRERHGKQHGHLGVSIAKPLGTEPLKPGDHAQLLFTRPMDHRVPQELYWELMWVLIRRAPAGEYMGVLRSIPTVVNMNFGQRVDFGHQHIMDRRRK